MGKQKHDTFISRDITIKYKPDFQKQQNKYNATTASIQF